MCKRLKVLGLLKARVSADRFSDMWSDRLDSEVNKDQVSPFQLGQA